MSNSQAYSLIRHLPVISAYCIFIMGYLKSSIAVCWTADGVYALCILIQCLVYIHKGKWQEKQI